MGESRVGRASIPLFLRALSLLRGALTFVMAAGMLLTPSDFEGEAGTAVAGRVVLARRVQVAARAQATKAKGKKQAKGRRRLEARTSANCTF